MAALATAAISRVGTQSSGAQAQVTITMTAPVRATSAPTAPASPTQIPSAPATTAGPTIEITPTTEAASRVQTQAARSSSVSRTTAALLPAASTSGPRVVVPNILPPSAQTPTPTATTNKPAPTPTKSTKTPTPSATSKNTIDADGSISESWWNHPQGRIHAACGGDRLTYAEPWAASGYQVTKSSTWIRTVILFDGSSPVSVAIGCHDGHATFSKIG